MTLRHRPMASRRSARGYILILVMVVLLVLTILVASLYSQASDSMDSTTAMLAQKVASARADQAVQMGIAMIKSGAISQAQFPIACTGPEDAIVRPGGTGPTGGGTPCTAIAGTFLTSGLIEGSVGDHNYSGPGGWQYQYWLYRRQQFLPDGGVMATNPQLVNVYAEGYFGKLDAGTGNSAVAAIEAEVMIPMALSGPPVLDGDYNSFK